MIDRFLRGALMETKKPPTACVLIIGNEILSGRTQDANLNFLATGLTNLGIQLVEARVIADVESAIVSAVNGCRELYDYVFTTGGIGPTHDDITAECIAKAFGVKLEQNSVARDLIAKLCERNGIELNAVRLRMANVPAGARLIENSVSAAPGFQMGNVFVLAGVPKIMRDMFGGCKSELAGGVLVQSQTVVAYLPEGIVAEPLRALQERFPDVEMGSYPFYEGGRFGTNLVLRSTDRTLLSQACTDISSMVEGLGGEPQVEPS